MVARKVISASVSCTVFAVLLGMFVPNPFGETISSNYLFSAASIIPLYLMYSFPVILLYGGMTSILSDRASERIARKTGNAKLEILIASMFHILFGLILLFHSLVAALLFFVTDRLLKRRNNSYTISQAIQSLAIPATAWLIFMGVIWIEHWISIF